VLGITSDIVLKPFDLTDPYNVFQTVSEGQFDEFYNLGAQSFVGASWEIPLQTSQVDGIGVLHVLDAIKRTSEHTKFYQASTSEMFGLIQEPRQSEKTPFYPRSPYGVAKQFAHSMTVNYRESFGLHASSGILFNHESPLRGNEFVTKKITRQLSEVKLGTRDMIYLGNIEALRDWGYAKEYVDGMWRMLQMEEADDYVLATGQTSSVRQFVEYSAAFLDIQLEWSGEGLDEKGYDKSSGNVIVSMDKAYYRPAEVDVLLGDPSKANANLGWKSKTNIQGLAELMVKFDYDEVKKSL
jgi:GDPmannose 4,6-dehydratase